MQLPPWLFWYLRTRCILEDAGSIGCMGCVANGKDVIEDDIVGIIDCIGGIMAGKGCIKGPIGGTIEAIVGIKEDIDCIIGGNEVIKGAIEAIIGAGDDILADIDCIIGLLWAWVIFSRVLLDISIWCDVASETSCTLLFGFNFSESHAILWNIKNKTDENLKKDKTKHNWLKKKKKSYYDRLMSYVLSLTQVFSLSSLYQIRIPLDVFYSSYSCGSESFRYFVCQTLIWHHLLVLLPE